MSLDEVSLNHIEELKSVIRFFASNYAAKNKETHREEHINRINHFKQTLTNYAVRYIKGQIIHNVAAPVINQASQGLYQEVVEDLKKAANKMFKPSQTNRVKLVKQAHANFLSKQQAKLQQQSDNIRASQTSLALASPDGTLNYAPEQHAIDPTEEAALIANRWQPRPEIDTPFDLINTNEFKDGMVATASGSMGAPATQLPRELTNASFLEYTALDSFTKASDYLYSETNFVSVTTADQKVYTVMPYANSSESAKVLYHEVQLTESSTSFLAKTADAIIDLGNKYDEWKSKYQVIGNIEDMAKTVYHYGGTAIAFGAAPVLTGGVIVLTTAYPEQTGQALNYIKDTFQKGLSFIDPDLNQKQLDTLTKTTNVAVDVAMLKSMAPHAAQNFKNLSSVTGKLLNPTKVKVFDVGRMPKDTIIIDISDTIYSIKPFKSEPPSTLFSDTALIKGSSTKLIEYKAPVITKSNALTDLPVKTLSIIQKADQQGFKFKEGLPNESHVPFLLEKIQQTEGIRFKHDVIFPQDKFTLGTLKKSTTTMDEAMDIIRKEPYIFQIQPSTCEPISHLSSASTLYTYHFAESSIFKTSEGVQTKAKDLEHLINKPYIESAYKHVGALELEKSVVGSDLIVLTTENGLKYYIKKVSDADETWLGPWLERGDIIGNKLGHNLDRWFPVVDKMFWKSGIVTSIKSRDLDAKTYQKPSKLRSVIVRDINKLAGFEGDAIGEEVILQDQIKSKVLEIAVPHLGKVRQQEVLKEVISYGQELGVEVKIIVYTK